MFWCTEYPTPTYYSCTCICVYVHLLVWNIYICIYLFAYMYIFIYQAYMCVCMYVYRIWYVWVLQRKGEDSSRERVFPVLFFVRSGSAVLVLVSWRTLHLERTTFISNFVAFFYLSPSIRPSVRSFAHESFCLCLCGSVCLYFWLGSVRSSAYICVRFSLSRVFVIFLLIMTRHLSA